MTVHRLLPVFQVVQSRRLTFSCIRPGTGRVPMGATHDRSLLRDGAVKRYLRNVNQLTFTNAFG